MPAKGPGPESQFASWRVSQLAPAIEYPLEVMEEIRAFACDELLRLSHGGDDVGGVLFGTRRDDLICIVTWRPMASDHTQGQGLRLSSGDRMNLAVQLEMARRNRDLKDLRPVGWFVSHVRGEVSLSPSDLEIYHSFFPEAWQVALVICPKGDGRAQAGFFGREPGNKVLADASYQCFDLEPPRSAAMAATAAAASPPQFLPRPMPDNHVEASGPASPPPEIPQAPYWPPSFGIEEKLPTRERWIWAIPIVLALGIAAFMLHQQHTSPGAAIALRALSEAQTVQLAWDANSRPVRDSGHTEIQIEDGGSSSLVSLTADQLHAGKIFYLPQSNDLGFVMTVYPANGEPIQDFTRLIAPTPASPAQPTRQIPAGPPEEQAIEQQVRQLREALGKERARADELQNLVRILENRLGIPYEAPRPGPPRSSAR